MKTIIYISLILGIVTTAGSPYAIQWNYLASVMALLFQMVACLSMVQGLIDLKS